MQTVCNNTPKWFKQTRAKLQWRLIKRSGSCFIRQRTPFGRAVWCQRWVAGLGIQYRLPATVHICVSDTLPAPVWRRNACDDRQTPPTCRLDKVWDEGEIKKSKNKPKSFFISKKSNLFTLSVVVVVVLNGTVTNIPNGENHWLLTDTSATTLVDSDQWNGISWLSDAVLLIWRLTQWGK